MEHISALAVLASEIMAIITLLVFLVRPLREKLFADRAAREGMQCLLRSEIVRIYYKHLDEKKMRQYEFENAEKCYKAYTKNGGNSFVNYIWDEMNEWTILP